MINFIVHYWLEVLFGIIVSILSGCYVKITSEIKRRESEAVALKDGVLAMLHDRMWQASRYYLSKPSISMAELSNFDHLYTAYHQLGGNGTGTEIYNRVHKIPLTEQLQKGEEENV